MDRKLIAALLLIAASGGCCTCSNCCDYLPPVLDGPYARSHGRAGSAMNVAPPIPDPLITPLPEESPPADAQ